MQTINHEEFHECLEKDIAAVVLNQLNDIEDSNLSKIEQVADLSNEIEAMLIARLFKQGTFKQSIENVLVKIFKPKVVALK